MSSASKSLASLPETGYLREPAVLTLIPVSRSTWWAGVKSGRYPAGLKLSSRVTAWRVEDIRALITQIAANQSIQKEAA
ncbi:MAG TPA: AlpA family phage regulatory protein [Herbaspirillum sp.]|uniref:helix-turn-helix transcriptional regulator n=1 Tax=Herbaspirillum sp. TaxID=1890675 RepID=UPI002D6F0745|nr:AlpA family phage regulatory protein [Herbaspirillum sp.]HZG20591.1 AlpA family phage regulatory protein [Herbaspirillum sp.]